jgi:glutamate-1-semialdehyde 2,1-aminomutase
MTAMRAFLRRLESPEVRALYHELDARWNLRAAAFNARMRAEQLPVQVANLSSIWTVFYTVPARYNWLLQYYLRAEGLSLSWVGTGRLIFSLDFTQADFDEVLERCVTAAKRMQQDGYFWSSEGLTNKAIKRRVLKEVLQHLSLSRSGA